MASTLDRGFKAWSERTAQALRRELGLAGDAPLQPDLLASHLGIILWTPHDVPGLPEDAFNQLMHEDPWGWSAVSLQ
ncbi:MAG TPA: hypothetical protein VFA15_00020, partial [Nitrososphaera sp.]|nr:hypothetical protein [Nitrososphaera sp.]